MVSALSWNDFKLNKQLLDAISESGFQQPTEIQQKCIPLIAGGQQIIGIAQTGTGKTAAYLLPLLMKLRYAQGDDVRAIILVPTKELVVQVAAQAAALAKYTDLRIVAIYGGVGTKSQIEELNKGLDLLIATPGRLLELYQRNELPVKQIKTLILDEGDRMMDMGFMPQLRRIFEVIPSKRQNLLFSATFPEEIRKLASSFMKSPQTVEVARRNTPAELVAQVQHPVDHDRKRELLAHLVKTNDWRQVLVFCKTKHGANRLAEQLERDGIEADAIHGNKSQGARTRALKRFKDNELRVLVATDIAARGLDIEDLPHVVNFDLPNVSEDYVHRIGRTGRAGASGEAVSLVSHEDRPLLGAIERLINRKIPQRIVPGFEPSGGAPSTDSQRSEERRPGPRRQEHRGGGNDPRRARPRDRTQEQSRPTQPHADARRGEPRAAERHRPDARRADARRPNAGRPDARRSDARRPDGHRPWTNSRPGGAVAARPDQRLRDEQREYFLAQQRAEQQAAAGKPDAAQRVPALFGRTPASPGSGDA